MLSQEADHAEKEKDATVLVLRDQIRAAIISGELAPGTPISQVQLAIRFGVSRTPMREALRMLQEDRLVEIERNRRARVAEFDADDLELVYANRILLSTLATSLSVPRLTDADLAEMQRIFEQMNEFAEADKGEAWRAADHAFHRLHCRYASPSVLRELQALFERATLYRLLRMRDQAHRQAVTLDDHTAIMTACRARDAKAAVAAVARHLSRIALALLAYTAPERDPQTVRTALQIALGGH